MEVGAQDGQEPLQGLRQLRPEDSTQLRHVRHRLPVFGSGPGDPVSATTATALNGQDASSSPPSNARPEQLPAVEVKVWESPQNLGSDHNWFTPDGQYTGVVVDFATGIHVVPPGPPPRIGRRDFDHFMMPGRHFGLQLREEAQPGANLLAAFPATWHQWTGEIQPAVTFNGVYGQLWIEPPPDGGLTLAVNRYSVFPPFEGGAPYELKLRASSAGSGAALFFFNDQYELVRVDGADWTEVIADQPWEDSGAQGATRFTWPDGVAYFVLQVRGRWNATSRDILWPELVEAG